MDVVFFGGQKPGRIALNVLDQQSNIVGMVPNFEDRSGPEDETISLTKFKNRGVPIINYRPQSGEMINKLNSLNPDLIWVTDYRHILPETLLEIPEEGAVNLHPSLLPSYRGRAPINWAIIQGESVLGLTAHFMTSEVDAGDIIKQQEFELSQSEDVSDALQKLYPLYRNMTKKVIGYFKRGSVPRQPQAGSESKYYPKRTPEDGLIHWNSPRMDVWNLIRAVTKPYPGAFCYRRDKKLTVWKAKKSSLTTSESLSKPGEIIERNTEGLHVQCQTKPLCLTKYSIKDHEDNITTGDILKSTRQS